MIEPSQRRCRLSDARNTALHRRLTEEVKVPCMVGVPLCDHSTWRIGGRADLMVEPSSVEQIARIVKAARDAGVRLLVIGHGANILFDDAGFRGLVLKIGRCFSKFTITDCTIEAQAGVFVPRLAKASADAGLTGLEHTVGIPASLGGLVTMNGGSQRRNIAEVIREVTAVDRRGQVHSMPAGDCQFSYRHSVFQQSDLTVLGAVVDLKRGVPSEIRRAMLDTLRSRRKKFPRREPNCGSVFSSSAELHNRIGSPGKVIEELGLKGTRVGDAMVSTRHANFIVNRGAATAYDVLELIRKIRSTVYDRKGVWLDCEVRYVLANGTIGAAHLYV